MIESQVIKILNLEGRTGTIDLYKNKKSLYFFSLMRAIMKEHNFSMFFYLIFKLIFSVQILIELLSIPVESSDTMTKISIFFANGLLFDTNITDKSTFTGFSIAIYILVGVYVLFIVYLLFSSITRKFVFPIKILAMLNFILADFIFIPIIGISLSVLKCDNYSNHLYLGEGCFTSGTHMTFIVLSFLSLIFFSAIMYIFTYYMNDIGAIGNSSTPARVNCNYEFYANFLKLTFFILVKIVKILNFEDDTKKTLFLLIKVTLFLFSFSMMTYINKKLYYFEPTYNLVARCSWTIILWSSLISIIKNICSLYDTTIFHIFGWISIYLHVYKTEKKSENDLLNDLSIFNLTSLKSLVSVNEKILSFCTSNKNYTHSLKGMSLTLAHSFDEILEKEQDLNNNHKKFVNDVHVKAKFKNNTDITLLSLVNVTYEYYLHMRKTTSDLNEENVFLHNCYFLIKYMKNICYASYLCTKVKIVSHKNKFLHYQLTEFIKEKLILKVNKINSNESIKQIQIGTLLAYEYYLNLFFSKLHDEVSKQCGYFSIFKKEMLMKEDKGSDSNLNIVNNSNFKAENFLKMGEEIMTIKEEIESAYKQILLIYPTYEIKTQFFAYLNLVMDDEDKIRYEEKNFSDKHIEFINEKGPIYKSLFGNNSSIVIADGFINIGALLYATPNFARLFSLEPSQIVNLTVHDLVPSAIEQFHYEVVMNGIKYSNLSTIFSKQRTLVIRGNYGQLHKGVVFIRNIPDLRNGMIYMISVLKVDEIHTSCTIALDDSLSINGLTNMSTFEIDPHSFICVHIAYYIPNIFLFLKYTKKMGYHFDDSEEHMATLFRLMPDKGSKRQLLDNRIEKLLKKIKNDGYLKFQSDDEDLCSLIQSVEAQSEASYTIVYKAHTRAFVNNTYKYHTLEINKLDNNIKADASTTSSVTNQIHFSTPVIVQDEQQANEMKGSDFFVINLNNESSHLASVFSGGSTSSNGSSQVQMSMKERLYNLSLSKKLLIREGGEINHIKLMKIICLIFTLITITLSLVSSNIIENNFYSINQFVIDNLFLNRTKIFMTCIYAYAINLNDKNYALYNDKKILTQEALEYVNYIHSTTQNTFNFAGDLRNHLEDKKTIYLTISNGEFSLNVVEYIDLILSSTLKFTSELNKPSEYAINQILWNDLIRLAVQYLNDDSIMGYTLEYQSTKFEYSSYFVTNNILFCLNIGVIILIIVLFLFLSYKILQYEQMLLHFAKSFKAPLFIKYLTTLFEMNRNYNNASKEDMDNSMEENEEKKEEKVQKKGKKTKDEGEEKKENRRGKRKGDDPKKKNNDMNFERIKKSFTNNCLSTIFKIMVVLILSLFYYVVTIILINSNVTTTLDFLKLTNDLEMYFQTNFRNFFNIKFKLTKLEQSIETVKFEKPSVYSLGNLLFEVKSFFPADNTYITSLDTLFTGNVCSILRTFPTCEGYQNAILTRGLDQAIVQTNLLLSNFIEEGANIRKVNNTLVGIYDSNMFFPQYEEFITIYLYYSYKLYSENMTDLKGLFISGLLQNLYTLLYCFLGLWSISFIVLLYIIKKMRKLFFSLIIFFNIIPSKHILEDSHLTDYFIHIKNKL